jgi:exodeoxyribonuclease VII large subunit
MSRHLSSFCLPTTSCCLLIRAVALANVARAFAFILASLRLYFHSMSKTGFFDFHEQVRRKPRAAAAGGAEIVPAGAASADAAAGPQAITVSQLTSRIDRAVRAGVPETVYVRGEISNFRPNAGSGHLYFTLKDVENCIDCVMWKSDASRLKFTPVGGIELLATGKVGIYGKQGKYQLYVNNLRPLGKGALELAFQQLRAKLQAEGLFAPERKRPLPTYPMTIALVTGANTAALQDMLKVLRRFAWIRLLVYPVPVQGQGAAQKIVDAIRHLSERGHELGIEAILLARGGGSLEDLWSFNEEIVARAIDGSTLPIVTGIGHEVDTSIADLVADYHAHTPTEAAQIISHHWRGARDAVDLSNVRLRRLVTDLLQDARQRLRNIERHEAFRRPMDRINGYRQLLDDRQRQLSLALTKRLHVASWRIAEMRTRLDRHMPARINRLREQLSKIGNGISAAIAMRMRRSAERLTRATALLNDRHPKYRLPLHRQRLSGLADRLTVAARSNLLLRQQKLDALARQLEAVGPENVLRRGYTITTRKKTGEILRCGETLKPGEHLLTRFADGETESEVVDLKQPGLFDG